MQNSALPSRAFPYLVALPLLSVTAVPNNLSPSVMTLAATAVGGVACLLGLLLQRRRFDAATALVAALLLGLAGWFALATMWSHEPVISLYGLVGQHNGAALWVLFSVWVLAGMLCADARALRETLAVVAATGSLYALGAIYEALFSAPQRGQGYAAGFFENSTSSGEVLGVALLAATVGALVAEKRAWRYANIAAAALCAGGLIQSSSRTGLLGVVGAVGFAAIVHYLPAKKIRPWALVSAFVGLTVFLTAILVAASTGALGDGMRTTVSALGTQRDVIWRAAWAQFTQSPLVGQGLEQFSTLIQWSTASGVFSFQSTTDPHNIIVAAALGGGVIGALLLLATFATLLAHGVQIHRSSKASRGVALTISMPAFALTAGLVGWLAPAAAFSIAAVSGAVMGAAGARSSSQRSSKALDEASPLFSLAVPVAGGLLAIGAFALAVGYIAPFSATRSYLTSNVDGRSLISADGAQSIYARHPEPRIPADMLAAMTPGVQSGSAQAAADAERFMALSEDQLSWSSLLAVRQLLAAQALEAKDASKFERFRRIAEKAAEGDPATGAWYALTALEAGRLGKKDVSVEYARKALKLELTPEDRALLERVAAQ